jgi:signal transduction histidine kinase
LGIKIKYETNADYAVINGDSGRIRQVFINIIDNAIKYCGSEIKITAIKTDKRIVVKITDDGCGIPENELPNVKKRFFKASNAVRGSGIGLSVVNEIVILHGGIIEILSKLGKGTTVIVSFGIVNE